MSTMTAEPLRQDAFGNWVIPTFEFEPDYLGPTWQRGDDGRFVLPERTLGYQAIEWAEDNLLSDDVDEHGKQLPWRFTGEQYRFMLWWYAIDEHGSFIYRDGILQRLKGWGPPR